MQTITPQELNRLRAAQPELAFIDVRTPVEFAEVHAEGALNIPLDELQPGGLLASGRIAKEQSVYVICRTGPRAVKAAEKFVRDGLPEPVVVDGGTVAWEAAGLPVERSAMKVISLERQVRIAAGLLILTGAVLGWLVHPGFFGLSAFVGAGLVFAGVTDFCGMGLLLAKLPFNRRVPGARNSPAHIH